MSPPEKIDRSWKSVLDIWISRFRTSQQKLRESELEVARLRKALVIATGMLNDEQLEELATRLRVVD